MDDSLSRSRYQLPELEGLCVDHILKTLRADTAMQYLLASSAYDELNSVIQDFVVECALSTRPFVLSRVLADG